MNVILLKDVEKLGLRGEVVNVARGYARNFLLPRNLAEVATEGRVKEVKRIDAQKAMHEARSTEQANEIAETLGKLVLRFDVKSGPTGSLFGSVTTTDIADEIWRIRKIRVDRRKIGVDNIKRIGRYTVPIDLFEGISAEVKLMVVPEGGELPPEEELAAMEAAEAAEAAAAAAAAAPADAVDESEWELVDDAVVLDEASVVEVEENAAGEIDDVVVIEDTVEARRDARPRPSSSGRRCRARGRPRRIARCRLRRLSRGSRRSPQRSTGPVERSPNFPLAAGNGRWITPRSVGEKPSGAGDRLGNTCSLPPAPGPNIGGFPSFLPCPFGTG